MTACRYMKRLLWNTLPALLALMLLATGCFEDKKVTTNNVVSVQITAFKMESKNLPELGKTFFSIDHRSGRIYNAVPLPYKSSFDTVKLTLSVYGKNNIKVLVGGEERTSFGTDSVKLAGWEKGMEIVVSDKDSTMTKRYRVEINRYEFDPETFVWGRADPLGFPDMSGVAQVDYFSSFQADNEGRYLCYKGDRTDVYSVSYPNRNTPIVLEPAEGLLHAKDVVYIAGSDADYRYALINEAQNGSAEKLSLSLSAWKQFGESAALSVEVKDPSLYKLIGGFIKPGERYPSAAVILRQEGSLYFGLASVENGNAITIKRGEPVPQAFPMESYGRLLRTQANYPLLLVAGGKTTQGSYVAGVWSTTTGLDWLCLDRPQEHALPVMEGQPLFLYDREADSYYYIAGNKMLSSKDAVIWHEMNRELALPEGDFREGGRFAPVGWIAPGHRMWLLGGKTSQGEWKQEVWRGFPKIYAQP